MTVKLDPELLAFQLKLGGPLIKKRAFFSVGTLAAKKRIARSVEELAAQGVEIFATEGTSQYLTSQRIPNTRVHRISEHVGLNARELLEGGRVDLVVNVAGYHNPDERSDAEVIRSLAIEHGVPFITDLGVAAASISRMIKNIKLEQNRAKTGYHSMAEYFAGLVHERGGYAANHGHYDKAYLITPESLQLGEMPMEEKWRLYRQLKEAYTFDDLFTRIARCATFLKSHGVTHQRTMVDADTLVNLKCVEAALAVKEAYKNEIVLEIGIQPLEGVLESGARKIVEKACGMADYIGGLPSRDNPRPEAHLDFLMAMAREQGKRLDVHTDQKGVPWEDETKLVALKTAEYGLEGRVSVVHAIISRKSLYEQREIAKRLRDTGVTVIVCPDAAVGMKQHDMQGQISNCIAPVPLLMEERVNLVWGPDNMEDAFEPLCDGDPWISTRILIQATRCHDAPKIADLMCNKSLFGSVA